MVGSLTRRPGDDTTTSLKGRGKRGVYKNKGGTMILRVF